MSRIAAPLEIRVTDKGRTLVLTYEAEGEMALSAEYLRVESPSAEVQGHTAKDKRIMRLFLTGEGEALLMEALKVYNSIIERVMAHSSAAECDRMGEQMRRIEEMLGND